MISASYSSSIFHNLSRHMFLVLLCVEKAEPRPDSDSSLALELPLGAFDVGFACYSDPDVEQQTDLAL